MYKKKYNLNFNIFEKTIKNIKCPNCSTDIDVRTALYNEIFNKIQNEQLNKEKALKQKEESLENTIKTKLAELGAKQYQDLSKAIKKDFESENNERIKKMEEELNEKTEKIKAFNNLLADNEKLKREKTEALSSVQLEVNKRVNDILEKEKPKISERISEEYELVIRQLKKQLETQKNLTEEQRRKLSQGSVQMQGEAQEETIEEWIKAAFPMDEVIEIKKGANGADCIHKVMERGLQECGSIYYESKNTKAFSDKWVEKFKTDMQEKNIDIGVIVTKTLPKEMKRMGLYKGVYVCTLNEFKGLCVFLRDFVLQFSKQQIVVKNKDDKKEMLYKFITSKEFSSRLDNLVTMFNSMSNNLEKEKKQATLNFEKRRGLLENIKNNVFSLSGRISGISGTTLLEDPEELLESDSFNLISLFQRDRNDFDC